MAHEITLKDKIVLAVVGAWHNLGKVFDRLMTPSEAFEAAIDWYVESTPAFTVTLDQDGKEVPTVVPNFKFIRRSDTRDILGVVGKDYVEIQNVSMRDAIIAIFGDVPCIESCFSIRGGEKAYMVVRLPDDFAVMFDPGDGKTRTETHATFLMFGTGHDGLTGWSVLPTCVRPVCANTVRAATGSRGEILARDGITIHHSSQAQARIQDVVSAYQGARRAGAVTAGRIQRLAGATLTQETRDEFMGKVLDFVLPVLPVKPLTDEEALAAVLASPVTEPSLRDRRRDEFKEKVARWEKWELEQIGSELTATYNAHLLYNIVSDIVEHDPVSSYRANKANPLRKADSDEVIRAENEFTARLSGRADEIKQFSFSLMEEIISREIQADGSVVLTTEQVRVKTPKTPKLKAPKTPSKVKKAA